MKTFLKFCPNCDTKKRMGSLVCHECGYDFKKNHVYSQEDDVRNTNLAIRKYIEHQKRKEIAKVVFTTTTIATLAVTVIIASALKDD